jgi:hypothetical protein
MWANLNEKDATLQRGVKAPWGAARCLEKAVQFRKRDTLVKVRVLRWTATVSPAGVEFFKEFRHAAREIPLPVAQEKRVDRYEKPQKTSPSVKSGRVRST